MKTKKRRKKNKKQKQKDVSWEFETIGLDKNNREK